MAVTNFPGVYTQVIDESFFTPTTSRISIGLIGPASAGPLNTPTQVISVGDFTTKFGASIPNTFLASAVQLVSSISDGVTVVRIARQYHTLSTSGASAFGSGGQTILNTPNAALFQADDYVRVSQIGVPTTVNAEVVGVNSNSIVLSTPLVATYTAATIQRSRVSPTQGNPANAVNAANEAEAFLSVPVWNTVPLGGNSTPIKVSGNKNSYTVYVQEGDSGSGPVFGNSPQITVGSVLLIVGTQSGQYSTREVMVQNIIPPVPGVPGQINFYPTSQVGSGYQAVSLQDQYGSNTSYVHGTGALVYVLQSYTTGYQLLAANPGTWANSDGQSTGLIVNISPGSFQDSKKLLVYLNSVLVETWDNLSVNPTVVNSSNQTVANPNYFPTAINGNSKYILFVQSNPTNPSSVWWQSGNPQYFANTQSGWQLGYANWINVAAFGANGNALGYDGENVIDADYIGSIDDITDTPTGMQCFADTEYNITYDVLASPGYSSVNVASAFDVVCRAINAISLLDIPQGLTLYQAIDWSNGVGPFTGQGKLNTYTVAEYFNWFTITDFWSGSEILVPPTCGALRAFAYTFDSYKPWFAAAGQKRGQLPEALSVQYPRISEDAKQSSYGNGNVVNSIILQQNAIQVYGNLTTQRASSKMTAVNNVILVNTVVKNLAALGQSYVFDPIDNTLYAQLNQDFTNYLQSVQNDQGIEQFQLIIDNSNNTAQDRNLRQVNVTLYIVPVDAMERLFITAIVKQSGAVLTSVGTVSSQTTNQ